MPVPITTHEPTTPHEAPRQSAPPGDELSFLAIVNALLDHRVFVVAVPLLLFAAVVTVGLLTPRKYTSSASFSLQAGESRSRLSGLAAQFGLAVPGAEAGPTPAFFTEVLHSRTLLRRAAETRFEVPFGGLRSGTLADYYEIEEKEPARRVDAAVRRLESDLSSNRSRETGIVTVSVTTESPALSAQLLTRILALLGEFNNETRQSQAANERRFVEARLEQAAGELRVAEARLREFLQRNRVWAGSPELSLQQDRLRREVLLRQELYTSLAQNFEQARIDEVRDTPAFTVIDAPNVPVRPAPRGLVRNGLLALLGGLLVAITLVLARVLVGRAGRYRDDVRQFEQLRRETLADLRNPFRPIGRALTRKSSAR